MPSILKISFRRYSNKKPTLNTLIDLNFLLISNKSEIINIQIETPITEFITTVAYPKFIGIKASNKLEINARNRMYVLLDSFIANVKVSKIIII
jgi:hypothetical protein